MTHCAGRPVLILCLLLGAATLASCDGDDEAGEQQLIRFTESIGSGEEIYSVGGLTIDAESSRTTSPATRQAS